VQRLLALLACLTLAIGVAALGRWPMVGAGDELLPAEAGRLLLAWGWMVAALLLPGLLTRLPRSGSPRAPGPLSSG
jgi:hypothetical protein